MKSIMLSIQPKWCELIASGKKTIEVRKTRPKLETPFKCYIYCTKSKEIMFNVFLNEPEKEVEYLSGKVIGEFVCDRIDKLHHCIHGVYSLDLNEQNVQENLTTCLTVGEVYEYGKGKPLYGWHISNLEIYDKPKELGEFYKVGKKEACIYGKRTCLYSRITDFCKRCEFELTRPPQAWCYVEG